MATYFRLLDVSRQFFDSNGDPLNGGKLYTYEGGTVSTNKATYQDDAGGSFHTNPIILDSAGRIPAEVWGTTGSYKLKLTDALDSVIWTADGIVGINDQAGVISAPTVEWLTSGTAATYTVLSGAKKLEVQAWGAGGGSGGVDGQVGGSAISGPGAGGGYCFLSISTPAASYTYSIGAAGTGGASGNNSGTAGGATTFTDGAGVNLSANGGALGAGMLGSAGNSAAAGAVGGTATGGDINISGGDAGGKSVVGGIAAGLPTSGAAAILGGGIRPNLTGAGIAARVYGEGGGSAHSNDATNYAGADGKGGLIKVTTFY